MLAVQNACFSPQKPSNPAEQCRAFKLKVGITRSLCRVSVAAASPTLKKMSKQGGETQAASGDQFISSAVKCLAGSYSSGFLEIVRVCPRRTADCAAMHTAFRRDSYDWPIPTRRVPFLRAGLGFAFWVTKLIAGIATVQDTKHLQLSSKPT